MSQTARIDIVTISARANVCVRTFFCSTLVIDSFENGDADSAQQRECLAIGHALAAAARQHLAVDQTLDLGTLERCHAHVRSDGRGATGTL